MGRKIEDLSRICNVIGEATRVVPSAQGAVRHYRMREGSITANWDPQLTRDWTRAPPTTARNTSSTDSPSSRAS
ncbi:hypothetical protein PWA56_00010 [Bifidobacterium longum subsp. longum]|uniref:Uncharacterized protein n=1 Tax=Bifidobacterium longum subsp. longum TaxID=1679 RepID=A0ABD7WKJ8_BIFLL|nr:hypothetical protein [Bifidobacterium longum]WDY40303.1 hypothetical protein PWA56_00010 [Bifidobacterium longum subsp. longum]